ncbi:hypothetical protein D3C77_664640 [compost metagenome]
MGEDDVVIRCQHFQHRVCDLFHRLGLMFYGLTGVVFDNAVATNGDDDEFFHLGFPIKKAV